MSEATATHPPRAASAVLQDLMGAFPNARVTAGELVDRLDARALGVLLLILALPMCIPNVPGISTLFGALMIIPALQLACGQHHLWLPARVRALSFPRDGLLRALDATIPTLSRIEVLIKPRLESLTCFPITILVGLQTLLLAIILVLPIPFANWIPGMTVAMTALALLQRDGLLMLLTIPAAVGSVASVYFGAKVGFAALQQLAAWGRTLTEMWL